MSGGRMVDSNLALTRVPDGARPTEKSVFLEQMHSDIGYTLSRTIFRRGEEIPGEKLSESAENFLNFVARKMLGYRRLQSMFATREEIT
jgi:hypothetical protein